MDKNWNVRLKEVRKKNRLKLEDISLDKKIGITKQTLIDYEKGKIYPKINVLNKLCNKYNVSENYILNGDETIFSINEKNILFYVFQLIIKNKISYDDKKGLIIIKENKIKNKIKCLDVFSKRSNLFTVDEYNHLLIGINKMIDEYK